MLHSGMDPHLSEVCVHFGMNSRLSAVTAHATIFSRVNDPMMTSNSPWQPQAPSDYDELGGKRTHRHS